MAPTWVGPGLFSLVLNKCAELPAYYIPRSVSCHAEYKPSAKYLGTLAKILHVFKYSRLPLKALIRSGLLHANL